ncbi:MAG TPA: endoribonuclease MazF [Phycisphaerae bacterium]|nr:endoribonuclease MazF [Phycisphaerae bacterium]HOJ73954.1 endoribonuclease MazF [Phycisphaerae bacterium]HOM50895.1 endoribonuclease MazF [Phycisphaerae bacterium]HON65546.1 endoribonuclease MazF [Phycisphaerae bacterium]HOQ85620.1 endoribonuclease MazF [Phycisphaerae bacterium]
MVSGKDYVPERGDLVFLNFSPQSGHEQAGRRPALVLSPRAYNRKTGLCLVCPVTRQMKGYPFEVLLPPHGDITGAILSDQIRSIDWRARHVQFVAQAPAEAVSEALAKIATLLSAS